MKLLLLHAWADLRQLRRTHFNHSFSFLRYAPQHDYVLHCAGRPIPEEVRRGRFDAILLDVSFLCLRWARPRTVLDALKADYAFVAEARCPKLAFPQDDYDHSAVLDDWMADWRVDHIFTPLARFRDILYPRAKSSAAIHPSLTGYVDAAEVGRFRRHARPWGERPIDVGYRAAKLPPHYGWLGRLKTELGERFAAALPRDAGLRLDIGNRPILGSDWLRFVADCRFMLGTASGSTLLDPRGLIRDKVAAYLDEHPDADFAAVEAACFPGQDGLHEFSALGPRNLEAAMARTCQILVPSAGLAPMEADRHFIPLARDMGNLEEVLAAMRDGAAAIRRAEACYELFVADPAYRYSRFVKRVLDIAGIDSDMPTLDLEEEAELAALSGERVMERLWREEATYLRDHAIVPALAGTLSPRAAASSWRDWALQLLRLCLPAGLLLYARRARRARREGDDDGM